MKYQKWFLQSNGFSLMELMVVIAIISLLAAIAIPNYIQYRNKGFCSQTENDAYIVSRVISDYFSMPSHSQTPRIDDLKVSTNNPKSHIQIFGNDPNEVITIVVKDHTGRCPDDYQRAHDNWNSVTDQFTKVIK